MTGHEQPLACEFKRTFERPAETAQATVSLRLRSSRLAALANVREGAIAAWFGSGPPNVALDQQSSLTDADTRHCDLLEEVR